MEDYYIRKSIIELFKKLKKDFGKKNTLSKNDLKSILIAIQGVLNFPLNKETEKYYLKHGIIGELILELHNSRFLDRDDRIKIRTDYNKIQKLLPSIRKGEELRFRILGNKGTYPTSQIKRGKIVYENVNSRPNLITINKIESEDQFRNDSWLYWISRRELKFATTLILSAPYRNLLPYFNAYDTLSLNTKYTDKIPKEIIFQFLNEWLNIKNLFVKADNQIFNREPRPDLATYNFTNAQAKDKEFNDIFDSYSIRNHLLLRTSNYLLKGLMNYGSLLFQEEALLNIFFALEGSLHLLQKKMVTNQLN